MTFCFRYILALSVFCTSAVGLAQDNELFSSVNPKAAFSTTPAASSASTPKVVTSGEQLREMLKSAGFEAKVAGSNSASAAKEIDPWTIPVLVTLSDDEQWIHVVLGLTVINDTAKELPAEKLLALMKASQDHSPANFVYHSDRKRTEVRTTLRNRELTGTLLRNEVNRLAIAARKTSDLWASDAQKTKVETQKPVASGKSTTPTLTGQWVASKSTTEAFALDLQASGEFKLVYIKDGQQTKSSGKYSISGSSLTLAGDSLNLVGSLKVTSEKEFEFTPTNQQQALKFVKAK